MGESLQAAVLTEYGKPPEYALAEIPAQPGDGQLLIDVEAAGLNPVDVALSEQRYTVPSPPVPYVPGLGGRPGRRVGGGRVGTACTRPRPVVPHGTSAARTLAYAAGRSDPGRRRSRVACAAGIAGIAAHASLVYRAGLQPGEHVVVLGATGVVGAVAVQVARVLEAGTIVAVGRNPERLEATRELGATATIRIGDGDLESAIRDATDGGANVVVDMLCGPPAEAALAAMAIGGRLVQLGRSAAETMVIASATVRGRALSILGHTNMLMPPDERRSAYEWLLRHAIDGALRVEVETVPLADVADAWTRQKSSPGHKLVLAP